MKTEIKKQDKNIRQETTKDPMDILQVKDSLFLNDGVHEGKINKLVREIRQGWDYTDLYIDVIDDNGNANQIKTGFPSNLTPKSSLYHFLQETMQFKLTSGQELSLKALNEKLHGVKVQFQTVTRDDFSRVINESIRVI